LLCEEVALSDPIHAAAAAVARAVRLKDPEAEREARRQLLLVRARVHRNKAAELVAQAEMLDDDTKKPVAS
jgi:hypothetical protein